MDKVKVIVSDCHLSAGRFYEGRMNPHEDFKFDDEFIDFLEFFSTGIYGEGPSGPMDVELFINGDFLDFLNVPYQGEFEDMVTAAISLSKVEAIFSGHARVMAALRKFAAKPNKKITYLIGNHDADLFFPQVRERIEKEWDPEGKSPSEKIRIIADTDRVRMEDGVEIRHGNQFEAAHVLNFDQPMIQSFSEEPVLNLPWGSIYVSKIVNRLKWEREYLDKIRPIKIYVFFGLLFDTWFTLKYVLLSSFYFFKTRFVYNRKRAQNLRVTMDILSQETTLFLDLEKEARELLDQSVDLKTVIFGHVHKPQKKLYSDGKLYINTGTWTKMINLDWTSLGQQFALTFAIIKYTDGKAQCDLREWVGEQGPHRGFHR